jgi:hypothetical protein
LLFRSAHKSARGGRALFSFPLAAAADARKINEGKIIVKDYNGVGEHF